MQDVEIIGMLKSYVKQTLAGMGALKGAACQIQGIVDGTDDHTITFVWEDNDGVSHTSTLVVKDGTNGTDGFSPTIVVKTSTDSTYILTITDAEGSYDTPNLKGSGGGGSSTLSDLTDVVLTALADSDILVYDATTEKWVNSDVLSNKVDKVAGKGLSTNDFTDALKDKLDGIEAGAEVNIIEEVQVNGSALTPSEKAVNIEAITGVKKNGSALTPTNGVVDVEAVDSVAVNGVSQTIAGGAVDLDVANNLITEAQWTQIQALLV
jgi:hypothetical protein